MKFILIAEKQKTIEFITFSLQVRYPGVEILTARETKRALEISEIESPDLVIINYVVPGIDTIDLITRLRRRLDMPMLILGEAGTDVDRAMCLEAGADEYLIEGFNPIELLATCNALLRRSKHGKSADDSMLSAGNLTINFSTREVSLAGRQVRLTPIEFKLLSHLAGKKGIPASHKELVDSVWGSGHGPDYGAIRRHIYRLRCKLGLEGQLQVIGSRHGFGYCITNHA